MKLFVFLIFAVSPLYAETKFYYEMLISQGEVIGLQGWNGSDVLTLKNTEFSYREVPTCVLDSKKDSMPTPDCPFVMDFNFSESKNDTGQLVKKIRLLVEDFDPHTQKFYTLISGEKFQINNESCHTDSTCWLVDEKGHRASLENSLFQISMSSFNRTKLPDSRKEIPIDFEYILPVEYRSMKELFFLFKGSYLEIRNFQGDLPVFKSKDEGFKTLSLSALENQLEPFEAWVDRKTPRRGEPRQSTIRIKVRSVDVDKKNLTIDGKDEIQIKLDFCTATPSPCRFIHVPDSAYDIALKKWNKTKNSRKSHSLNVLVKNLLPCVKSKDLKCIEKNYFSAENIVEGEGDWVAPRLPFRAFSASDLPELEACLNYDKLLVGRVGTRGIDKICLFAPDELSGGEQVKLAGVFSPEEFRSVFFHDMYLALDPLQAKDYESSITYSSDDVEIDYELPLTIDQYNDPNIQGVIASGYPHLISQFPPGTTLNKQAIWTFASEYYRALDFLPVSMKTKEMKLLELRFENVYRSHFKKYLAKKRFIHPHFLFDQEFVASFFRSECYQDVQYLNGHSQLKEIGKVFLENVSKFSGFSGKCIPYALLTDAQIMKEVRKVDTWVSVLLPRRYYGSMYYEPKREKYTLEERWQLPLIKHEPELLTIISEVENQKELFKEFPLVIKYLGRDFPFSEKALTEGLSSFYNPQRLFREDQLKVSVINSFLQSNKKLSSPEQEKTFRQTLLVTSFSYTEMPFALMTSDMINDDEFIKKISENLGKYETLAELGYYRKFSPSLTDLLFEVCKKGSSVYNSQKLWNIPWIKNDEVIKGKMRQECRRY